MTSINKKETKIGITFVFCCKTHKSLFGLLKVGRKCTNSLLWSH